MTYKTILTSNDQDWETPQGLVDYLELRFNRRFDLDVCATDSTRKCTNYITRDQDAFSTPWFSNLAFMNPPYDNQREWIEEAIKNVSVGDCKEIWCLIPARTDTRLFHDVIVPYAHSIMFVKGRIYFSLPGSINKNSTHPSMIVIFKRSKSKKFNLMRTIDIPLSARRGY